jgi:hypothetical protein
MGQRSVAMPRRESTLSWGEAHMPFGRFSGVRGAGVGETGEVPKERAVITS